MDWEGVAKLIAGCLGVGAGGGIMAVVVKALISSNKSMLANNEALRQQLIDEQKHHEICRTEREEARRDLAVMQMRMSKAENSIERLGGGKVKAVVSANAKGIITSWGAKAVEFFGFTAEEVVGHPLTILMAGGDRTRHSAGFAEVVSGKRALNPSTPHPSTARHRDGTLIKIVAYYSQYLDEKNEFQYEAQIELA